MVENKTTSKVNDNYENHTHFIGRITLALGFILSLLPPLLLWLVYGILPPLKSLLKGIVNISVLMLPVSVVEVLAFAPILGAGAMYMSYLTGNISNMKIPSAAVAIEATEVKPSTRQGDIIANIAIAGSVLVGMAILILGVILIAPLSTRLNNPILQPAFAQILPALFGSIGAYYILKEWRLAVVPVILAVIFSFTLPSSLSAITIPVCVGVSIFAARFLYKKKLIKADERLDD